MKPKKQHITIIITALSGLLTATSGLLGGVVSSQLQQSLRFALPAFGLVTLISGGLSAWLTLRQEEKDNPLDVQERENRQQLLKKVNTFWIAGVLDHSLYHAVLITLKLHMQPSAITHPWNLTVQQFDQPPYPLPDDTPVLQAYDAAEGQLLILGEPGSGKTTLLLELARDLLDRAQEDNKHPIPVVFNLSSWALKRQPLVTWLIEELNVKYQVPHKLGQSWVEQEQILPLLDGLDEVASTYRSACIDTINSYQEERSTEARLVICSRSEDYLNQSERLSLRNAVVIQPVTSQQVDDYLLAAGEQLALLRVAMRHNQELLNFGKTPFMLNVLSLAYQHMSIKDLFTLIKEKTPTVQRQQIFEAYVRRMLRKREGSALYTSRQVLHWLNWLAKQMVQYKQTEFYIERMQIDWLSEGKFRRALLGIVLGVIQGLAIGMIFALAFIQLQDPPGFGLLIGVRLGLFNALVLGLYNGVVFRLLDKQEKKKQSAKIRPWSWTRLWQSPIKLLGNRVGYALLVGLLNAAFMITGLAGGLFIYHVFQGRIAYPAPVESLLNAAFIGISCGLLGRLDADIQPAEVVVWSWRNLRRNIVKFLVAGLFILLLIGLLVGPVSDVASRLAECGISLCQYNWDYWWYYFQNPESLIFSLRYGLVFVLIFGSIFVFRTGLTHGLLEESSHVRPNQGIWNSARNGVWLGLVAGSLFGLVIYLFAGQITLEEHSQVLGYALPAGLAVAVEVGLLSGGLACLQHLILRLLLWSSGALPWNYPHFLDDAAEKTLLRKVGGGYIFIHRLLLEYLATINAPFPQGISRRTVIKGAMGLGAAAAMGWFSWSIFSRDPRLLLTYTGHSGAVDVVGWSPNGNYIASGSNDKTVQIWNAADGNHILTYHGHTDIVNTLAWSPNAKRIASGSDDKTIQVWDVADGGQIFTLVGHSDTPWAVAWSPDGKRIALVREDQTVQIRDATTGNLLRKYSGHTASVFAGLDRCFVSK